jgi:archaemetzincin
MFALAAATLLLAPGCHCGGAATPKARSETTAKAKRGPPELEATVDVQGRNGPRIESLHHSIAKLAPLHRKLDEPKSGQWLAEHDEPGQTFAQYRADDPVMPDLHSADGRKLLYIQPLGALSRSQRKIVLLTSEYMTHFYGLEVKVQQDLPLSLVPAEARRVHPSWGKKQILTSYVLERLLRPRLPADAAAYISFTASDLWPGQGWNFVFGQASLRDRVGVWSINRHGDPDESEAAFRRALLRAVKVAVHETGHMFSLRHCTAFQCVMGGSNSLDESDAQPLWLCPECAAKVAYATGSELTTRYEKLLAFAEKQGFDAEAAFFRKSLTTLR